VSDTGIVANDVDTTITPDSLNPPTWQGRKLSWSGEGRIPEPGEIVYAETGSEETEEGTVFHEALGVVTGYWQAYGRLGVKVKLHGTDKVVYNLGSEIDLNPPSEDGVAN
jgi:hypothetical protein